MTRPNRYLWLGTRKLYDAFTFLFERTEHGWFQAHVYKFDEATTTFIVETPEHVWKAHGLDQADQEQSIAFCEKLFAANLQGERLMTNARHLRGSAWLNFQRVRCEQWWHFNGRNHVVLMGDAVHTAHFAIGSGTKLAIEDAIELTRQFNEIGATREHIPAVLERYQALRGIDVLRLQNAAWNAMEWFEAVGQRYADTLPPEQFMYSMLTRSQRISHENLRLRDGAWLAGFERWFAEQSSLQSGVPASCRRAPAADVHALQAARRGAEEPCRRLADGAVLVHRWRSGRVPPGAPGRARDGWRRPGGRRDDLPFARRAHHARHALACGTKPSATPGSASSTGCTARPTRRSRSRSGMPAPRARPTRRGRAAAPTGLWPRATGRSSPLRRKPISKTAGRFRTR